MSETLFTADSSSISEPPSEGTEYLDSLENPGSNLNFSDGVQEEPFTISYQELASYAVSIGFGTCGVALIISLGIAVIIKLFKHS